MFFCDLFWNVLIWFTWLFSIGGERNCWAAEKEDERDRDGVGEAKKTANRDGQKREGGEEEDGGGVRAQNAGGEIQERGSSKETKGGEGGDGMYFKRL